MHIHVEHRARQHHSRYHNSSTSSRQVHRAPSTSTRCTALYYTAHHIASHRVTSQSQHCCLLLAFPAGAAASGRCCLPTGSRCILLASTCLSMVVLSVDPHPLPAHALLQYAVTIHPSTNVAQSQSTLHRVVPACPSLVSGSPSISHLSPLVHAPPSPPPPRSLDDLDHDAHQISSAPAPPPPSTNNPPPILAIHPTTQSVRLVSI